MDLRTSLDRLHRHRGLVGAILVVGGLLVAVIVALTPPRYVAQATILMVAEPPEQQNRAVPSTPTKPILSDDLPALVQSATVIARAARDVHSPLAPADFAKLVRAKVDTNSNIMPVSFTGTSASSAIAGANAVADELTTFYREIATSRFDSLAADLRAQLRAVRVSLTSDDRALAEAARQYPYIDTKSDGLSAGQSAYARVVDLEKARDDTAAAAAGSGALARVTATILGRLEPLARSELGERDPRYRLLRDQYARDLAEFEREHARYAPSYPGTRELSAIVAKERSSVATARAVVDRAPLAESPTYAGALADATKAAAAAANDQEKLAAIKAQIGALKASIDDQGVGARVARIRRDRDARSEAYALLSARLAATIADRAQAASTGSVMVAERASYAKQSRLSTGLGIAIVLALLVGWLAYGVPALVESLNRRFRIPANIEHVYGAPIVGVV